MKEVCFVNKGDNIKKLNLTLGIPTNSEISKNKILEYNYIEIESGDDDIVCVKNYNPFYIKKLTSEYTLLDVYAAGYEQIGGVGGNFNDTIVVKKINGIRYIVQPMETLDAIAYKLGVDKNIIIENNNLQTDKLFVGQILIV